MESQLHNQGLQQDREHNNLAKSTRNHCGPYARVLLVFLGGGQKKARVALASATGRRGTVKRRDSHLNCTFPVKSRVPLSHAPILNAF